MTWDVTGDWILEVIYLLLRGWRPRLVGDVWRWVRVENNVEHCLRRQRAVWTARNNENEAKKLRLQLSRCRDMLFEANIVLQMGLVDPEENPDDAIAYEYRATDLQQRIRREMLTGGRR